MNIKNYTEQQKQAILDLATITMYADGKLALAEDERILRLLNSMGYASEFDRTKQYDAAVARVEGKTISPESVREYAQTQTKIFTTREQRRHVASILDEIAVSDSQSSESENNFITIIRDAFAI